MTPGRLPLPRPDAGPSDPDAGSIVRWSWLVALVAFVAHLGFVPGMPGSVGTHALLNYDDPRVVELAADKGVAELLTSITWYAYKPVYFLSVKLDLLFAPDAAGFGHIINLLLFAGCALLLVRLLADMTGSAALAAVAGLLFAVHPAHVESVAWLSGRKDVLSLLLVLLAHRSYRATRERDAVPLLAPFLLLLGGLAKGTVWPWAGLLLVDELIESRRGRVPPGALARLLPVLLVGAGGVALDMWIGRAYGPGAVEHGVGTSELAAAMAGVNLRYLLTLLAPVGLSLDHPVDPAGAWTSPWALAGLALAAAALVGLVLAVRRQQALVAYACAFWLLGLLPVNNVLPRTTTLMAERYLLVAALGVYLLLAAGWRRLGAARPAVLATAVVLLGALTLARTRTFADSERVWADAVAKEPQSALAWAQRAQAAAERKEWLHAVEYGARAEALAVAHPRASSGRVRVQAHLVKALAFLGQGDMARLLEEAGAAGILARAEGGRSLALSDARRLESEAEVLRGQALRGLESSGAREAFARALALDPDSATAAYNLATVWAEEGGDRGYKQALGLLRGVRRLRPDWLEAGLQLATVMALGGWPQESLALYAELERRHGRKPEILFARAQQLLAAGDAPRALADLETLRREHPDHPKASRLVYDLYVADGRRLLEEARRTGEAATLTKSLERFDQALSASKDWTDAWLGAGDVLYEQGLLLKARDRYRQAVTRDAEARWMRGLVVRATTLEAAWNARHAEEAPMRRAAARLMADALGEGTARVDLGLVPLELELGLLRALVPTLEGGREPAASWAGEVLRAAALLAAGDDGRAEAVLAPVLSARPHEHGAPEVLDAALMLRGGLRDRETDVEAARRDYAQLAERRPQDPAPRLRLLQVDLRAVLARYTTALGFYPGHESVAEARERLKAFEARAPDASPLSATDARAIEEAHSTVRDAERVATAQVAVDQVGARVVAFADAQPQLLEAHLLAAEAEMRRQEWVQALRRLNGLVERFPAHPSVLRGQAAVFLNQYLAQQDRSLLDEALRVLKRAMALDPRDPRTALDASGVLRIRGDFQGALQQAARARAYENLPGGPAARELAALHVALGGKALEASDAEAARKAVAAARRVDPVHAGAYQLEGRIALELERKADKALVPLMKAKELEPANLEVDRLLSLAYYQRGQAGRIALGLVKDPPDPTLPDPAAFGRLPAAEQGARRTAHAAAVAEQTEKRRMLRLRAVEDLNAALRLDPSAEHTGAARLLLDGLERRDPDAQRERAQRASEAFVRGVGLLETRHFVDAFQAFEEVLSFDSSHRRASFYLVQAAYERLLVGQLPDEERRNVTNRAFERLQALDALDPEDSFPLKHLYRGLLNEILFRKMGAEDARQSALRAYDRFLRREAEAPSDDATHRDLARRRRELLARALPPRERR